MKGSVTSRPPVKLALALLVASAGCGGAGVAPAHPTWADVAPILRGECGSCHGWTASDRPPDAAGVRPPNTGGSLRFDFYDVTTDVCGDAALALDQTSTLAGAAGVGLQIESDVVTASGARWPRMPPQPSPAMPGWQVETLTRWAAQPVKGPPPPGNRPPTIAVGQFPSAANAQLGFTAIIDDPDGDSVLGVVELNGLAFLMNRPGAFAVEFDSSSWAAGSVHPIAILCDGWSQIAYDLGPVQIRH